MAHVPIAQAKDRLSEYVSKAMAGDEVVLTKHGKPTVKLVPVEEERRRKHQEAIEGLVELGREIYEHHGPTDPDEIRRWLDEDRRFS